MTPRDFLREYNFDQRVLHGGYYPSTPLEVSEGERVGVVLLNLGGPETLDDVEPFLYNRYMDPVLFRMPVGGILRHWYATLSASLRAPSLKEKYELIGGGSPLARLTREQAEGLQTHLNEQYGQPTGVDFRTYVAMRYWSPFSEGAAAQMEEDDVDKVVLLPMYPQYSKTTSGTSLAYWNAADSAGDIPTWPTTTVYEYAANPKYVQALSERIDEGLQRFPRGVRGDVHLVFSGRGAPARDKTNQGDPYCCLVHSTVEQVMRRRGTERPFHTAFQTKMDVSDCLAPSTTDTLADLAENGVEGVLIVPVASVTDHLGTSYELDIEIRERAEIFGIDHYEVTSGLNTHPLFIEALAEATLAQLEIPIDVNQLRLGGDGLSRDYPLRPLNEMPRCDEEERTTRCQNCEHVTEAHRWTSREELSEKSAPSGEQTAETSSPESSESSASGS